MASRICKYKEEKLRYEDAWKIRQKVKYWTLKRKKISMFEEMELREEESEPEIIRGVLYCQRTRVSCLERVERAMQVIRNEI